MLITLLIAVAVGINAGVWVAISWPLFEERSPFALLLQSGYVAADSPLLLVFKGFEWISRKGP